MSGMGQKQKVSSIYKMEDTSYWSCLDTGSINLLVFYHVFQEFATVAKLFHDQKDASFHLKIVQDVLLLKLAACVICWKLMIR